MMETKILDFVICNNCGNGLFARCDGDVRECSCGNLVIRGVAGTVGYKSLDGRVESHKIERKFDEMAMYEDMENMTDRFGLIKDGHAYLAKSGKNVKIRPRAHFEDDIINHGFLNGEDNV